MPGKFEIKGCVAFVTGTNKKNGIGRAILEALIAEGAAKVYATARDTAQLDELVASHGGKVVAVALDVTSLDSCATLGENYPDVTLVVNNAGYCAFDPILGDIQKAHSEMQINYFGPLAIAQSFAPVFKKATAEGKPTAFITVASIGSQVCFPPAPTYSASKAAVWMMIQALRMEMRDTLSMGVFPGPIDTDMAKDLPFEKDTPETVAAEIMKGLKEGTEDIFTDKMSVDTYAAWKTDHKAVEAQWAAIAAGEGGGE